MDPEQGLGVQATPEPQAPAANSVPKASIDDSFAEFKEHSSFNTALALTWMVAVFSILATLFFWWMNKNETDALADKKAEKDSLIQQISSPGSIEIENKALDFKSSVSQLKRAYAEKYSYSQFLTGLNTKLTNDVKLNNIAVTDGTLNLTGTTTSYRSVADLMMALKSWDTLENIELLSVANNLSDNKTETVFAISAKLNKDKQKTASVTAASSGSSAAGMGGGSNATVQ